jgi:HD-like signal output (HDOD) protein
MAMNGIETASPERAKVLRLADSLGLLGTEGQSFGRLLAALCDPDAGMNEVSLLIEQHALLSAQVLRVANSAFYRHSQGVTTVRGAIMLMGVDAVRALATAISIDRTLTCRMKGVLPDLPALLVHSLATAVGAQTLARVAAPSLIAESFMAGLLHNTGVLIQGCLDPAGVQNLVRAHAAEPQTGIRELEARHVSLAHEECAAALFEAWQLPQSLIMAAGFHHHPVGARVEHRKLSALTCLGSYLAVSNGLTFSLEPQYDAPPGDALAILNLDEQSVAALVPSFLAKFKAIRGSLGD